MEQNFLYKKVFFNTFMSSIQDGPNRHFGSLCSINNGPNPTAIQRFHFHENKCLYILRLNTGKWNTNSDHHELTFDKTKGSRYLKTRIDISRDLVSYLLSLGHISISLQRVHPLRSKGDHRNAYKPIWEEHSQ